MLYTTTYCRSYSISADARGSASRGIVSCQSGKGSDRQDPLGNSLAWRQPIGQHFDPETLLPPQSFRFAPCQVMLGEGRLATACVDCSGPDMGRPWPATGLELLPQHAAVAYKSPVHTLESCRR